MCHSLGEYNQAKELQEKALIIRKKISGENHADVATSYNLASVYHSLGDFYQAEDFNKKALMVAKRFLVKVILL